MFKCKVFGLNCPKILHLPLVRRSAPVEIRIVTMAEFHKSGPFEPFLWNCAATAARINRKAVYSVDIIIKAAEEKCYSHAARNHGSRFVYEIYKRKQNDTRGRGGKNGHLRSFRLFCANRRLSRGVNGPLYFKTASRSRVTVPSSRTKQGMPMPPFSRISAQAGLSCRRAR